MIQKNYAKAAELYRTAIATAPKETGSHSTTWRQATRLMAKLGASNEDALSRRHSAEWRKADKRVTSKPGAGHVEAFNAKPAHTGVT